MKKLTFIIALVVTSLQTSAQDLSTETLLKIIPGKTTQAEAEQLLGKAPRQMTDKMRANWSYNENGNIVVINWNEGKLTDCTVSTKRNENTNWDLRNNRLLDIGTDVSLILIAFGSPDHMQIKGGTHRMQYKYQARTLHLSFNEGKLLRYEMSGTLSKL
jgi:hypothetical protein